MTRDLPLFLGQFLRHPHQIAALAPSSPGLARAMAAALSPATGRVAELGPGTGRITRAILARGVRPADLTLVELNPGFVARLRAAFPGVAVHHGGAETVGDLCLPGLGAVVSGLPLLSMSEALQRAILRGALRVLGPGGIFVQFTYGPRPPLAGAVCRDLGLSVAAGPRIWANLPPARVYTYRRA